MLLGIVGAAATAHAETVEELTATARNVARDGRCEALPAIGQRVKELDADYYARVFAVDPAIAGCTTVDPRKQIGGPPSMTPASFLPPMPREAAAATERKSTGEAFALSGGSTMAGVVLLGIASHWSSAPAGYTGAALVLVGPTLGHIYAGDTWNTGLAVRLGSSATFVLGAGLALRCIDTCSDSDSTVATVGALLGLFSAITYAGATFYEIGTAPEAAAKYNREHHLDVTVVPTGTGLAVAGTF